ncbi:MAG: endonuclease III [Candidatus Wildermuthbacteria bacterium RIFCSPLOWO2_01_FULL_48_29]|uniref:Endonuclease III n=2 Tax=Parcubacteria group TaxID=1794811 RepID=A0A1G2RJY4_9BACT|nr:MAG: endonuclease III [Candidatus Yanofskybacteria bacterium RIFCSPHIGHO2_01_FULL_48_25b]OHA73146.1 MAG: endonuclease III [Candidatus Wildermuthbacteria bacterium RIFCSPLOWO2_01_FULL_48_29]
MVKKLRELFPDAKIVLKYSNTWELLVAVRLSAQCTDKKVNEVTEKLFEKYKALDDYVKADVKEFEKDIKPTGFYKAKAKSILEAARIVKEKYGGKVPDSMEELTALPGLGRKSAIIVLGNAYGKKEEGIAVDTHVMRLSQKLGLSQHKDPVKIERNLMGLVPKKDWFFLTYGLIEYGRHICPARKHKDCAEHPLTKIYPPAAGIWP